jgi:myo-inositol 2-dehydrogenase/D-chiro-inositol 1-dehydrogenase
VTERIDRNIRYGFIGTGMMGREHIANVKAIPGAEVAAIADPDENSLNLGRELTALDEAVCYRDYHDLIADDSLDAIVISTPNHTHGDVVVDAIQGDAHLLIEKPLAINVPECNRIIQAAAGREKMVWVGLEYRYKPPISRLVKEVHQGRAGVVRMVAIREHRFPFLVKVGNWNRFNRNTGGTLVEKCCHFFDLMNLITQAQPVRVLASGSQAVNHLDELYEDEVPDIIDNAYVIIEYDNGARAMLDLCMFAEASKNEQELVVTGDHGKIEAFVPENIVRIGERASMQFKEFEVEDSRIVYHGSHEGSSYLEHLDFIEAIGSGSPEAGVTLEDGRLSVAIGVAAHMSIDEGRAVMMDEVL